MKQYMGIDQYGEIYYALGAHPRKELCERFGSTHIQKMYTEYKSGIIAHTGYIIKGRWVSLYEVIPFRKVRQ